MDSSSRGNEHVQSRGQDNSSTKYPENSTNVFKMRFFAIYTSKNDDFFKIYILNSVVRNSAEYTSFNKG